MCAPWFPFWLKLNCSFQWGEFRSFQCKASRLEGCWRVRYAFVRFFIGCKSVCNAACSQEIWLKFDVLPKPVGRSTIFCLVSNGPWKLPCLSAIVCHGFHAVIASCDVVCMVFWAKIQTSLAKTQYGLSGFDCLLERIWSAWWQSQVLFVTLDWTALARTTMPWFAWPCCRQALCFAYPVLVQVSHAMHGNAKPSRHDHNIVPCIA